MIVLELLVMLVVFLITIQETQESGTNSSDMNLIEIMRLASKVRRPYKHLLNRISYGETNETNSLLNVKRKGVKGYCNHHWGDFRKHNSQPGWDQFQGRSFTGENGFAIANNDRGGSRIRKANWVFQHGESYNYINFVFRGAPDSGKNSYVCIREPRCQDDFSDSNCDEIDIVELYGSYGRAEAMSYRWTAHGQTRGTLHTLLNPGTTNGFHFYELWHWPSTGHYAVAVDQNRRDFYDGPRDRRMMLYVGIWDCSAFCGPHVDHDTWMELQTIYLEQCFS